MPSLRTFSDKTGLPKQKRWSEVYEQVKSEMGEAAPPLALSDLFWYPELLNEMPFQKCLRQVELWWNRLPESWLYAADVALEKRLRPDFSPPGPPKAPLQPTDISPDRQQRVYDEGINIAGTAEQRGPDVRGILNASHFSNDPGNWSINGINEPVYRAVPKGLLLEILEAYPRAGQANSPTEAVQDTISWLLAHGITAVGHVDGRGRYVLVIVEDGDLKPIIYDPHNYQRILDPDFYATPDQVHSGQYNNYREGPYDTKYGEVFI